MEMPKEIWVEETPNMRPWNTVGRGTMFIRADLVPTPPVTVEDARDALKSFKRSQADGFPASDDDGLK